MLIVKDYSILLEQNNDHPVRNLLIEQESGSFQIIVPEKILLNCGDFFQAILNKSNYGFKEQEMKTLTIKNEIDSSIEIEEWIMYFDLSAELITINSMQPNNIKNIFLIANYFNNIKLITIIRKYLDNLISTESSETYLHNFIHYYVIYNYLDKSNKLLFHLNKRLADYEFKYDSYNLFTFYSDMINLFGLNSIYKIADNYSANNRADTEADDCAVSADDYVDTANGIINNDILTINNYINDNECEINEDNLLNFLHFYQVWWKYVKVIMNNNRSIIINKLTDKLLIDPYKISKCLTFCPDKFNEINNKLHKNFTILKSNNPLKFENNEITILDEISIKDKWNLLTLGLLDDINWNNMILAGGSVNKLLNPKIISFGPQIDLDLFIYGTANIQKEKLKELLEWFTNKYKEKLYLGINKSIVYLWVTDCPRYIQIILHKASNVFEILSDFDLSHCQIAYNGNQFLMTADAIIYLKTQSTQQLIKDQSLTYNRLFKNQYQGYSLFIDKEISDNYETYMNKDNNYNKFLEKYKYDYFYPNHKLSIGKNIWELKKHYFASQVYFDNNIHIDQVLNQIKYCSDFHRDYNQAPIIKINNLEELNNDYFQIGKMIQTQHKGFIICDIKYNNHRFSWNLPKLKINSVFNNNQSENRNIYLFIPPEKIDIIKEFNQILKNKFIETRKKDIIQTLKLKTSAIEGFFDRFNGFLVYDSFIRLKCDKKTKFINGESGDIKYIDDFNNDPILESLVGCFIKCKINFLWYWCTNYKLGIKLQTETITYYPNYKELIETLVDFEEQSHINEDFCIDDEAYDEPCCINEEFF